MGWTGIYGRSFATPAERKAFVENELCDQGCVVLAVSATRNDTYAAIRDLNGQVFAVVVLFQTRWDNGMKKGMYKIMTEDMVPYFYNCPNRILDLLSPTDNEYALKWRRGCRIRSEKKWRIAARKRGGKRFGLQIDPGAKLHRGKQVHKCSLKKATWFNTKKEAEEVLDLIQGVLLDRYGCETEVVKV